MNKILITGAAGQLGRALNQLLEESKDYEIYLTKTSPSLEEDYHKLDITNDQEVMDVLGSIQPDIIINCTAMTAVDLCESEEEKAYRINAIGPKNLAMAAKAINATLVHVSTDYVYDGEITSPYIETDRTNPLSVYGKTKLQGEEYVQKHCKKFFIVRTAWVYGEGKNFVKTMLRLAESGNQIRVVADQYGNPTSAIELAKAIIALIQTEEYGIYHATCEGMTTWYDFACKIFELAGLDVEVKPITTEEYPTPARRPKYSVLDNKGLRERIGYTMKDWKEALAEYMKNV